MKREQKYLIIPFVVMGITWLVWYKQEDIHTDSILKESMSKKTKSNYSLFYWR